MINNDLFRYSKQVKVIRDILRNQYRLFYVNVGGVDEMQGIILLLIIINHWHHYFTTIITILSFLLFYYYYFTIVIYCYYVC